MIRLLLNLLLLATAAALIPREQLVSDPIKKSSLSPDGKNVGFIAPDVSKILNVFVWKISERQKRQVTFEESNVLGFTWTGVQDVIIFTKDNYGDENYMMFARNVSEGAQHENVVISSKPGVTGEIVGNNKKEGFVLIGLNDGNPSYCNIYKYDIFENQLSLLLSNSRFGHIYVDNNMHIRIAQEKLENGTVVYFRPSPKMTEIMTSEYVQWEEIFRLDSTDAEITKFHGFDKTNENVYWIWGEDIDLGELVIAPTHDITQRRVIHAASHSEISDVLFHPQDRTLLSISEYYHTPQPVFVDESIADEISSINKSLTNYLPRYTGLLKILDKSLDFRIWLVSYITSQGSREIFVYNRTEKSLDHILDTAPDLKGYTFSQKIGFNFTASDALTIQCYLSLPPSVPLKRTSDVSDELREFARLGMIPVVPQKMVLFVHGGPAHRDGCEFSQDIAFMADRGYAVLQVNFRGSTGFGKKLYSAGYGEWSRKMHSDLIEAVEFVVSKGIANRSSIAIVGGSYGGYAALVGMTFTPDTFACGIDLFGPSNLITLLDAIPPIWKSDRAELIKWMGGDPETEEGRRELATRSPLSFADRVKKPLLIMQGANDVRVKQEESEQFVAALSNYSLPFTYVLFLDEGHGFKRTPNHLAEFGHIEKFLYECLGGEYQPFFVDQYGEYAIVRSENVTA